MTEGRCQQLIIKFKLEVITLMNSKTKIAIREPLYADIYVDGKYIRVFWG